MRPVSRRHSRRGLVGGSTFRRTPISRSPLDKNPMPGHLSELQPVNAVNTKGQFFRASFGKNNRFQIQLDKRPLSPGTSREASGVPCLNPRRGLTDRKSTRLNSSHHSISYAVFCLKKKKNNEREGIGCWLCMVKNANVKIIMKK